VYKFSWSLVSAYYHIHYWTLALSHSLVFFKGPTHYSFLHHSQNLYCFLIILWTFTHYSHNLFFARRGSVVIDLALSAAQAGKSWGTKTIEQRSLTTAARLYMHDAIVQLWHAGITWLDFFFPLFSHNSSFILKIQNDVLVPIFFSIQSTVVIQLLLGMALLSHTKTQLRVLRYPSDVTQDLF